MKYDSTAYRILRRFAHYPGLHQALTLGDLFRAINACVGTAVYQRMKCDVIGKGWDIRKTDDNTYWMPAKESRRARVVVKRIALDYHRQHAAKVAA